MGGPGSGGKTERFIHQTLIPIAQDYNVTIHYDNTACEALVFSSSIQNTLRSIRLPANVDISITGNQCMSWGTWEYYLGKAPNVSCKVGTDCRVPEYPSCAPHLNRGCLGRGDIVRCLDKNNQEELLICCQQKVRSPVPPYEEAPALLWIPLSQCPSSR